ncbi:MAG: hypothetical protein QOF89_4748 [Acidobacteriota bacterium]|jgi:Dyp-type peroxidase family|nr:hypothetical protein [Acidobacteriota bacterium]
MILEPPAQAIDLSIASAIDPVEYRPMLERLQGNILKAHGRDHVYLLLLRFSAASPDIRSWVRSFTANWITSASEQLAEAAAYRQGGSTGVFGSLLLTARGYEALGYSLDEVGVRFQEQDERVKLKAGMAGAQAVLNDPDVSSWDEPYKYCLERPIHAMALLAADSQTLLEWASARLERSLQGIGEVAGREVGAVLRDDKGRSVEPFGFVDGISQPLFFKDDVEREKERGGNGPWDPSAPLALALIADPFTQEQDCFGSFLVFRKLEQDVRGFRARLRTLAQRFTGDDEELAGAFAVGRFRDGSPVIVHRSPADADHDFNNFIYFQDFGGARCPFHAHTRKTNRRNPAERVHRIIRRGVPYDSRKVREGEATEGVGLLFLCFQANIGNQFAFIQEQWANAPNFPVGAAGVDPLIGRGSSPQSWQTAWDVPPDGPTGSLSFGQFVTLKGGEFFFAPSIPFLRGAMTAAGT